MQPANDTASHQISQPTSLRAFLAVMPLLVFPPCPQRCLFTFSPPCPPSRPPHLFALFCHDPLLHHQVSTPHPPHPLHFFIFLVCKKGRPVRIVYLRCVVFSEAQTGSTDPDCVFTVGKEKEEIHSRKI